MTELSLTIVISLYLLNVGILSLFGAHSYVAIWRFFRGKSKQGLPADKTLKDYPRVLVQLPVYNEESSIYPLLDAIRKSDYPHGKMHVQILDDSDDRTTSVIKTYLQSQTIPFHYSLVRRSNREGYKAGALKYGMELDDSPFIVIFDADFRPAKTFIRKAVEKLIDKPHVGLIQGRWAYTNEIKSLWTHFQAIGMDGHFAIEQPARAWNDFFMNFNGTAGIFRRTAIIDAGNWQGDTLTEDLDLSYRAQLAGWKFEYAMDLPCPSEIPETIFAFKSQQFRWAKGSIQTLLKLYPAILSSGTTISRKIEAGFHLMHYLIHPFLLFNFMLSNLILLNPEILTYYPIQYLVIPILVASLGPSILYQTSQNFLGKKVPGGILFYPLMISLGCAMALNNSFAVLQAFFRINSPFVRTPKLGNLSKKYQPTTNHYFVYELLLAGLGLYSLANTTSDFWFLIPFVCLYTAGFLTLSLGSFVEWLQTSITTPSQPKISLWRKNMAASKTICEKTIP